MQKIDLSRLIDRQRAGWSLEQPFYTCEEIYALEQGGWLAAQWYVIGHTSEVADPGCFIVRSVLGESLIVVRDRDGVLKGYYNVCRHRGSRICDVDGRATHLMCPYHAWTYRLDGSLRSAAALPQHIDRANLGLRPVRVRDIGGVLFGSLTGELDALAELEHQAAPMLEFHGIRRARVAARRSYPTRANWKLVIENFIECYHCLPAHPEYSGVMQHVDAIGRDAPDAAAAWQAKVQAWFRSNANPESPVTPEFLSTPRDVAKIRIYREPIGGGRKTQSRDGEPVAPLMGNLRHFDGGYTGFSLRPFIAVVALSDHAVLFQFMPVAAENTDVVLTWLVDESTTDKDVDIERMTWLWDVTTAQDKALIERNAAGVRSRAYTPGPYSTLEDTPAAFVGRYLRELAASVAAE